MILIASNNRLRFFDENTRPLNAFCKLLEVQLSATLTTWAQLRNILKFIPSLRLVEMGHNRLLPLNSGRSDAGHRPSLLVSENLEILNLDGNELVNWLSVCESLETCTR